MKRIISYSIVGAFCIFGLMCSVLSTDQIWPISFWSICTYIFSMIGAGAISGAILIFTGWISDSKEPDSWENVK